MITLLVILAVSCQFLIAASFSPPKYVRIGGLFSQFDLNNAVQPNGRQLLAAFLMAVRDINTDHKILPNTTILVAVKDSKLSVGKTFFDSLNLATKSFQGAGIDSCIGSYTSGETAAAATVFTQFSTPQISYSSTSPQLSTKINYPFFARTCPSDAFQGAAIADLVFKYYGW